MPIPAERLREGEQILVRGKISFSRLATLVDGEALIRSVEQARKRGALYPTTKPHTTVSLVDAQVLPANPAAVTQEEQYVHEKIYSVKSGDNAGKPAFNLDNVSTYLPTILELDPENPGAYRQLVLDRDLASGMDVTLVIETYKPAGYEKRGLGLQQVLLNEEVRYFSSGVNSSALAARGIVVNGPIRTVAAADSPALSVAAATQGFAAEAEINGFQVPANTGADANGFPVPTPGAQGIMPAAPAFPPSAPVAAPLQAAPLQAAPLQAAPPQTAQLQAAPLQAAPLQAAPGESMEQELARLRQMQAEQAAALAASGGASAFDAAPAVVGAGEPGPWDVPGQGPAAYQG